MKVIEASYEILTPISDGGIEELQGIERAARTCYKSEDRITENGESARKLVKMLIERGHEAMLEHSQISVRFTCDRGVSHELVRHRIASFAQESTRYCNYSGEKFGRELTFIRPCFWPAGSAKYRTWVGLCEWAEAAYIALLEDGATPQEARAVLPNSLKTEVIMTADLREWRHFFRLRCAPDAHPQMLEITVPLLSELKSKIPVVFDDI